MNAYINELGQLKVESDNPTEQYALNAWADKNFVAVTDLTRNETHYFRGSALIVGPAKVVQP